MYTAVVQVENADQGVRVFRAYSQGGLINRVLGEVSLMLGFTVASLGHLYELEEDISEGMPEVQVDWFIGDTDELAKVNM